ncbi:MAG: hypothetical protein ACI9EZ_001461 [Halobacteriales archaeon]|jgi:hypothetical protein
MRRRTFLRGATGGLGALLAGCTSTASEDYQTNDLVLQNTLEKRVNVRIELTGEIDLDLVYPLAGKETARIQDYISEGQYTLTANGRVDADGEDVTIDDTATQKWSPEECNDMRVIVFRHHIRVQSEDCETATDAGNGAN